MRPNSERLTIQKMAHLKTTGVKSPQHLDLKQVLSISNQHTMQTLQLSSRQQKRSIRLKAPNTVTDSTRPNNDLESSEPLESARPLSPRTSRARHHRIQSATQNTRQFAISPEVMLTTRTHVKSPFNEIVDARPPETTQASVKVISSD